MRKRKREWEREEEREEEEDEGEDEGEDEEDSDNEEFGYYAVHYGADFVLMQDEDGNVIVC